MISTKYVARKNYIYFDNETFKKFPNGKNIINENIALKKCKLSIIAEQ